MYGSRVAVVNLVAEEKEKLLWNIFAEAIADLNSPDLYYVSYDYHAHSKRARKRVLLKCHRTNNRYLFRSYFFSRKILI